MVPAIRYPYFDPTTKQYSVVETAPITLDVARGTLASSDTVVAERLPLRTVLRPERAAPLSSWPFYWLLLALAPVPATLRRVLRLRQWRAREQSAAKRIRDLAGSHGSPSPHELRRLFLDALRERVPAVGHVRDPLARVLRRAGVSDAAALEAESMLARLDDSAFSGSGTLDDRAVRDAAALVHIVDREALPNACAGARTRWRHHARPRNRRRASRGAHRSGAHLLEGVRAYQSGQFAVAERRFAQTTNAAPRAVDAWVNLGVAAWEAADTAQAARAWHYALRLDPLESETRERLGSIQALGPRSAAYVAPLSIDLLAGVVLALWLGGWVVLALSGRGGVSDRLAGSRAGASLSRWSAWSALFELRERLEARDLGVLTRGRALLEIAIGGWSVRWRLVGAGEAGRLGATGGWLGPHHLRWRRAPGGCPPATCFPIEPVQPPRLTGSAPAR